MVDSSAGLKWVESVWCGEREDKPAEKKEREEEGWGKTHWMLRWRSQEVAASGFVCLFATLQPRLKV